MLLTPRPVIRLRFTGILPLSPCRVLVSQPSRQIHPAIRSIHVFVLDSRLRQDTLPIGDFPLCTLLLSNDSNYPWFILVPKRSDISEVFQLEEAEQAQLWTETTYLSAVLSRTFAADKMNVAALGNVVSQLHMHVIVRRVGDAAWPAPVWGRHPARPYSTDEVGRIVSQLKPVLTETFIFKED
jgi:diadenosine tetraphosphate (Ap4A) HIT family hydrolase